MWNISLHEWELPSRPTPAMHDCAVRRPNCLIESVQKVYNSLFSTFTGSQSQPKDRWRVNCCTHLWYLCLKFPLDKLLSIFPSLFTLFFRKLLQILSYILSLKFCSQKFAYRCFWDNSFHICSHSFFTVMWFYFLNKNKLLHYYLTLSPKNYQNFWETWECPSVQSSWATCKTLLQPSGMINKVFFKMKYVYYTSSKLSCVSQEIFCIFFFTTCWQIASLTLSFVFDRLIKPVFSAC